jgi:cyclic pyranopterin phosphate synthase
MPKEGVKSIPHNEILTYDEIVRLCKCFARLGINKVKITGGEPLVRKGIADLISRMKRLDGIKSVTLTTNGVNLKEQLPELVKAGIDGINISLDTLNPETFEKITGKDVLHKVFNGILEAINYPELRLKINCVPMQDTDKADIIHIAGLAKKYRLSVRFIEMMPIGLGKNYQFYSEDKIIQILEEAYGAIEVVDVVLGNGPAHYYSIAGFVGNVGFISALSHQFCGECNRVRLTSSGFLKTCLHYDKGADLKKLLRGNQEDNELEELIKQTIFDKPSRHNFNKDDQDGNYEKGHMSNIGG